MKINHKGTMKKLKDIFLNPLKTTFYLSTAIGISTLISTGFILIWGNDGLNWLMHFPLTKGFLHADFEHFYYNIIIIFFLLLFPINRNYDFKKLFLVTSILSLIGLFFDFLWDEPAIGISATLAFLLARVCWSPRKWWGYALFLLIIYQDLNSVMDFSDELSQHNHLIGALIGILSMTNKFKWWFQRASPKIARIFDWLLTV